VSSPAPRRRMAWTAEILAGLGRKRILWPLATLVFLLLFNLVTNPHFFSITIQEGHLYGSLIDILNRAAPLMVIAVGLTLVIATHGIDVSVGAVVAISGAVAAILTGGELVNGLLVAYVGMQPIIATLILMVAGRGIAQLITEGQIITIYYSPFFFFGNGWMLGIPFSLVLAGGVLAVFLALTRKTALGLFIESIGINPVASRFAGVRARSITFWVYALCGLCSGIAGIIVCANVKSADGNNAGLLFELDAILAVVLGGTSLAGGRFTLLGSIVGALIIQTLTTTIYAAGVPPEVTLVVKALVVFLVSVLQSDRVRNRLVALSVRGEAR
jgi:galactofuranose transport system permease protein